MCIRDRLWIICISRAGREKLFWYSKKFTVKKICKESLQIRFINKYVDEVANETIKKIVIEKM